MRLVLMGPPGAGKGTQAKRLAERFGMTHLSSGDILRAERASGSDLGRKLQQYMDVGALVPDGIVVDVMAGAVARARTGLLLDGFPRTVPQAQALDEQLDRLHRPLAAAVVLDVPDALLVERITGRRSCPSCGKVFHTQHLPPARDGRCDACGADLVQRSDDTEAVVRQRLAAYRAQTAPVIAYYRSSGRTVLQVDGSGAPDEVTRRLAGAIGAAGAET